MCRSIKTLRPPYLEEATPVDVEAAALQYVRKVAGMRRPSRQNDEVFNAAVGEIAAATQRLLDGLSFPARPAGAAAHPHPHSHPHPHPHEHPAAGTPA